MSATTDTTANTSTSTTPTDTATNPESKKNDDTKKMWSTNYRETENPAIRQKWIDNAYGASAPGAPGATATTASGTTASNTGLGASLQIATIFLFAWVLLGLIAFVWSLYCFRKSGSIEQKIIGFFLAVFMGPLFFIYFRFSKNYCK